MSAETEDDLTVFANSNNIAERWDAARKLMANKAIQSSYETDEFRKGWAEMAAVAARSNGVEQALAIDLIVRVSQFVKKLKGSAETVLRDALQNPPVALETITESGRLPSAAKPAEIRENIAIAMKYAHGAWVKDYLFNALANEDRSGRCRAELAKRIAEVEPNVEEWFGRLAADKHLGALGPTSGADSASARLRDIASALAEAIRENRRHLKISSACGVRLGELCRGMISIRKTDRLPKSLPGAAVQIIYLLEEIIGAELTVFIESETFAAADIVRRWWLPLPLPEDVDQAFVNTRSTLISAITLRARWGQKSEDLLQRLGSAAGEIATARSLLLGIARDNPQLDAEILDWLNGIRREKDADGRATAALRLVSERGLLVDFCELLKQVYSSNKEVSSVSGEIEKQVLFIAHRQGLVPVGEVGEKVEFFGVSHETSDGTIPDDPTVTIKVPGVARTRSDGTIEYIIRAIVE